MAELLYELDSGASCLPPGSEIVFVNCHPPEDTLGALLRGKTLTNVKVMQEMRQTRIHSHRVL